MKLIKPSAEILDQKSNLESIYEAIETAGRLCYKSERPEGKTAKEFVDKLINMKHYSVLEHGTVYLKIPREGHMALNHSIFNNPYTKWRIKNGIIYLTTNYRVLVENDWLYLLKYLCRPTKLHERRVTVHFITSIGIVRELLRHRKFSFSNESTRYCNYSKDKFDNELTFILPSWSKVKPFQYTPDHLMSVEELRDMPKDFETNWAQSLMSAEINYLHMIKVGYSPQEAREVLPLATKSELIMTGFESDWKELFDKRVEGIAGTPHPDMKNLLLPLLMEFINRSYSLYDDRKS